jgi:hypothetical protein
MRSGVVVRTKHSSRLARAAYARYGQLVRVRGRLRSPEGNPLQDVEVQAWTQIRDGITPPRLIATVKTSRTGSFTFLVRKGPSRAIKIRYNGTTQIRGVTKNLSLNVRSATSIRSNHKRVVNGEAIRWAHPHRPHATRRQTGRGPGLDAGQVADLRDRSLRVARHLELQLPLRRDPRPTAFLPLLVDLSYRDGSVPNRPTRFTILDWSDG